MSAPIAPRRAGRWVRRGIVVALGSAWLLAAGVTIAADRTVEMTDNEFGPRTVTIRAGDRITWTNSGQAPHNAVGDGWATDTITSGGSDAVRFRTPGRYAYVCTFHEGMRGTVVVRAASSGGGGGTVPTQPPTDAPALDPGGDGWPLPAGALAALTLAGLGGFSLAMRRTRQPGG